MELFCLLDPRLFGHPKEEEYRSSAVPSFGNGRNPEQKKRSETTENMI
jgi:hypothetical protein